jgi:hypothetical protein
VNSLLAKGHGNRNVAQMVAYWTPQVKFSGSYSAYSVYSIKRNFQVYSSQFNSMRIFVCLMYSGRVRTSGSEGKHNRLGALSRLLLYERPTSSPS